MGRQLKIKLLPNGRVEMTTEGIKGKKCMDYIEFIEKLADVKVQEQSFTPEYYEESVELTNEQPQKLYNKYE